MSKVHPPPVRTALFSHRAVPWTRGGGKWDNQPFVTFAIRVSCCFFSCQKHEVHKVYTLYFDSMEAKVSDTSEGGGYVWHMFVHILAHIFNNFSRKSLQNERLLFRPLKRLKFSEEKGQKGALGYLPPLSLTPSVDDAFALSTTRGGSIHQHFFLYQQ